MNFLFDANLSYRLADGLNVLESGNDAEKEVIATCVHSDFIDELGTGAKDPQLISYASKSNSVIISQDDDFKRIQSNARMLKDLKVGYILYKPPKHGSRYWEIVESFILSWKELKVKLKDKEPPFVFIIDKKGKIAELPKF